MSDSGEISAWQEQTASVGPDSGSVRVSEPGRSE